MRGRTVLAGWLLAVAVGLTSITLTAQQGGPPSPGPAADAGRAADGPGEPPEAHDDDASAVSGSPADAGREQSEAGRAAVPDGSTESTASASGDPWEPLGEPLASCVRAFLEAQKLRRAGHLLASRDELGVCARGQCPTVLANKCVQWHREVTAALPTVVIAATDPAGRDTLQVRVTVDGRPAIDRLDGRPLPLDPGVHVLRFEHRGSPVIRRRVVLSEGEKNRRLALSFTNAPTGWAQPLRRSRAAPRDQAPSVSPVATVGYGVGGAGLLVGVITGIVALSELSELEESCPNDVCPTARQDDFDRAATVAHVSTASFVVAGLGAAVGTIAVVASVVGTDADAGDPSAPGLVLEATVGPGTAAIRGAF